MFRGVLSELHRDQLYPTEVYNDNKSNILLGNEYSGNFSRIRYFIPKVHWLLAKVKEGVAKLEYLNTRCLPPDMETKTLSGSDFEKKRMLRLGLDKCSLSMSTAFSEVN